MSVFDLYIDTARKVFVSGPGSSTLFTFPPLTQGDTVTMNIRCLNPTANFPFSNPPYSPVQTTGRTLQLAIGDRQGNHLTEQYSWTPGGSAADPYFTADVALNTGPIATFLTGVDQGQSLLQINLIEGTTRTVFLDTVTIEAAVIKNSNLTVPAGLTPASMEAVLALLRDLVTNGVTINSLPNGGKSRHIWLMDDGTPRDDIS